MRLLILLILLFAPVAMATDGDVITVPGRPATNADMDTRYLCDSKVAADAGSACSSVTGWAEMADIWRFYVNTATGCSAWSVSVRSHHNAGETAFTVCTLTSTTTDECTVITREDGLIGPYLSGYVTTATGCTDLDLIAEQIKYRY